MLNYIITTLHSEMYFKGEEQTKRKEDVLTTIIGMYKILIFQFLTIKE